MVTCSDNMHDIGGRTVTCQCQNTMLVIMWFCDLKKTVINNHQWRKLDCHYASIRIQPRQYSTVQTYPYFCWLDNTLRGMSLIQKKILVFFNIGILYSSITSHQIIMMSILMGRLLFAMILAFSPIFQVQPLIAECHFGLMQPMPHQAQPIVTIAWYHLGFLRLAVIIFRLSLCQMSSVVPVMQFRLILIERRVLAQLITRPVIMIEMI